MDAQTQARLRSLPSVQEILQRPEIAALARGADPLPEADVRDAVRQAIAARRAAILAGAPAEAVEAVSPGEIAERARRLSAPTLRPVINATGVVVHTNLGRSPLPDSALEAIGAVCRSYSNLEYDLDGGGRGHRHDHAARLLCRTTGAEAALVVNNCAAAVLLALAGLARDREVIVSRGEEVEIGGAFRVPDVMRQSGARLVEVGTTNRTRLRDYADAITPETGLLLKVHRSNFAVVGFTEEVGLADLVALGRERRIPVMMDLGAGLMLRPPGTGFHEEHAVSEVVASGVDLVTFSGDKLLGGPQAGILLGRKQIIQRLVAHPLLRALRPDKITLAALQAVLVTYLRGDAPTQLPTLEMLWASAEALAARRDAFLAEVAAGPPLPLEVTPVALESRPGGGSSPLTALPSAGLAVSWPGHGPDALAAALRRADPPVIGRIEHDRLLLDFRTLRPHDLPRLHAALRSVGAPPAAGSKNPT